MAAPGTEHLNRLVPCRPAYAACRPDDATGTVCCPGSLPVSISRQAEAGATRSPVAFLPDRILATEARRAGQEPRRTPLAQVMAEQPLEILQHELRRPLSNLVCATELLLLRDVSENVRREALTLIMSEGERMVAMLDELRASAAGPERRLSIRPRVMDLRALLEETTDVASLSQRRPIVLSLPDDLPPVLADPARTRQVVANLLANALAHTPVNGTICLSARVLPQAVEVVVADSGDGIDSAALSSVFSRYFRVEQASGGVSSGDGLGLAIVREIVEAQGGMAWIRSDGPGLGTDVGFTVPRAG